MKSCRFVAVLKVFYPSTHKTQNCLCTADFYCVHGTQRSEFCMRTERKIERTYTVHVMVIYFAVSQSTAMVIDTASILWEFYSALPVGCYDILYVLCI